MPLNYSRDCQTVSHSGLDYKAYDRLNVVSGVTLNADQRPKGLRQTWHRGVIMVLWTY